MKFLMNYINLLFYQCKLYIRLNVSNLKLGYDIIY